MHKTSSNRSTEHEIVGWANKNARQSADFQRPAQTYVCGLGRAWQSAEVELVVADAVE